jgi:hypothetical protein
VSEHLCQGDWGGNFSKEILHLGKSRVSGLSSFQFSSQGREAMCVREEE